MASYKAVATGNFSNVAIWNIWNGSAWIAASVIPSDADNVWANNFIITIDQSITVLTLRNTSNSAPAIVTVGGSFLVNGNGLTITCLSSTGIVQNNTVSDCFTITGNGNNTFNINILGSQGGSTFRAIVITSTGTVNWVGSIYASASGLGTVYIIGNCIFNFIGDLRHTSTGSTTFTLVTGNSVTPTLNIIGNIGDITANQSTGVIRCLNNITLNITGNIISPSNSSNIPIILEGGSLHNVFVVGNITAGLSSVCISSGIATYIKIIGTVTASNNFSAISLTNSSSVCIVSGPIISSSYGRIPLFVPRICFINSSTTYWDFVDDLVNGASSGPLPNRFILYSPDTIVDAPIPANVRQGTIYALGTQTGTLAVPSPSDVRKNTPTDNTVGTADLTAQDFLDLLSTSPDPIAERLRNVATVQSTGDQITSLS